MPLKIDVDQQVSDISILQLEGRLDAVTAQELKSAQRQLVSQEFPTMILDLAAVPFIDSSGLAALVSGLRLTREVGGTLKLAGLADEPATVLKLTRLDRVFELYPDVTTALASLEVE